MSNVPLGGPMSKRQSRTEFFESIIEDQNVPGAQVVIFFGQAYEEKSEDVDEQLRLLDLLVKYRPELEDQASREVLRGF